MNWNWIGQRVTYTVTDYEHPTGRTVEGRIVAGPFLVQLQPVPRGEYGYDRRDYELKAQRAYEVLVRTEDRVRPHEVHTLTFLDTAPGENP